MNDEFIKSGVDFSHELEEHMSKYSNLVFVIDFSWLYYRSKFAFNTLSFTIEGVKYATGTIYGVHDALMTIMETYGKNVKIILAMDGNPKKQLALNNSYKAAREGNVGTMDLMEISRWDIAKAFLILPNISIMWHSQMEADDTMAFIAKTKKKEQKIILFSGDGDLRQLISSNDNIYCSSTYTRGEGYLFEGEEHVWEEGIKGLDHVKIDSIALYLAIVGDSSDGINGIPRFRTASAKEISNEFKTIDNLKAFLEIERTTVTKYDKEYLLLKENLTIVERNYKMINLDPIFLPLIFKKNDFNENEVDLKWFDKYGCNKVYNDLQSILG